MATHIASETYTFLSELNGNNHREWFEINRPRYESAWENLKSFTAALIDGLSEVDPFIPADVPVSKCVFRIYRDTRFSKEKSPYKPWLGLAISATGKQFNGPGYYVHVAPGNTFLACGYWRPEKEHLSAIRQEIDYNGKKLRSILQEKDFAAQLQMDTDDQLKRPPQGYDAEHPEIKLLKLKSFTVSKTLSDAVLTAPDALAKVLAYFKMMYGYKLFLHEAIGDE